MNLKLLIASVLLASSAAAADVRVNIGVSIPPPPPDRVVVETAPAPWAPAPRATAYEYYYYPDYDVYYRSSDRVWIYNDRGHWRTASALPGSFHIDFQRGISLRMNTDRPYRYHEEVVRRYPRGYFEQARPAPAEVRREGQREEHRVDERRSEDRHEEVRKEEGRREDDRDRR